MQDSLTAVGATKTKLIHNLLDGIVRLKVSPIELVYYFIEEADAKKTETQLIANWRGLGDDIKDKVSNMITSFVYEKMDGIQDAKKALIVEDGVISHLPVISAD